MAEVRIPVANTVGKTVRINPNATVGAHIGKDLKLPDGTVPSLAELASALASEAVDVERTRSFRQLIDQIANSQVPVGAVTQHQAALTILESQITDGSILAREGDDANFAALTATSYGGITEANLVDKTADEDIAGQWSFKRTRDGVGKYAISVESATPFQEFFRTGAGADEGRWSWGALATSFVFRSNKDNDDTGTAWLIVNRTAEIVDNATFGVPILAVSYGGITEANLLDKSATEDVTGSWTFSVGPTFFSAGTEGAPGIPFDGDPDTGAYSPGANIYAITVGGTEAIRYTGASAPLIRYGMTTGVTASTTQTQGQQPLPGSYNEISICANNNDVVTLPSTASGETCIVINSGAKRLQVFPASGQDLGNGVNQPQLVKTGASVFFVSTSPTAWFDIASKVSGLLDTDVAGISANDFLYYDGTNYKHTGGLLTWNATLFDITGDLQVSGKSGFYGKTAIAQQTGVAVTSAGIHAALVNLGFITA